MGIKISPRKMELRNLGGKESWHSLGLKSVSEIFLSKVSVSVDFQ